MQVFATMYDKFYQDVDGIIKATSMAYEQTHRNQEIATLPCNNLPVAQNQRFFGRGDILRRIEEHLTPDDTSSRLASIAIHGLGGVGKTQIALAYAYQKLDTVDAVFWISAEDEYTVEQDFSRVALDALKLPEAHHHAYRENTLLVLDWFHKTSMVPQQLSFW